MACRFRDRALASGSWLFVLTGELDNAEVPLVRDALDRVLDGEMRHMVVDLSGLQHINGAGVRLLLETSRKLVQRRGRMVVHSVAPAVHDVFELTGFTTLVPQYSSREAAVTAVSEGRA